MKYLTTFIRNHKRYHVVYTAKDYQRVRKAQRMYDNKEHAIAKLSSGYWAIGVR